MYPINIPCSMMLPDLLDTSDTETDEDVLGMWW
jgi:hypothetical protein